MMNDNRPSAQDLHLARNGGEIVQWADKAMFESEPMPEAAKRGPVVTLLSATPDPLGAVAAMSMMYEGKVVRNLNELNDDQRRHYFQQIQKTHLKAPFEAVDLHFMIEGVTRSFTHQMVRQRTAVFAQESMRFAVKENLDEETPLPPSLAGMPIDAPEVRLWRQAINKAQDTYETLVSAGVPAEDARGLLPHSVTTRLHYKTNLRGLYEHLGNRLCTQAQFEWRAVAVGIVDAIRNYDPAASLDPWLGSPNAWQFNEIANLFRPICYLTGKCEFKASFDRSCSIRARVDKFQEAGVPSSEWHEGHDLHIGENKDLGIPAGMEWVPGIDPLEWLADPTAARREG